MKKTLVFRAPRPLVERTLVWDITLKFQRDMAYVDLFRILDAELDAYRSADSVTCALIGLARNGNPEACEALLCYRRNRDGEKFEEVEVRSGVTEPVLLDKSQRKVVEVRSQWVGETAIETIDPIPLPRIEDIENRCADCNFIQKNPKDLIVKGDHHGGKKRVCIDRDACHKRSP